MRDEGPMKWWKLKVVQKSRSWISKVEITISMPLPINQHFTFESHQRQQCIRTLPRNYSINQMTHANVPALTVSNDKLHHAWRLWRFHRGCTCSSCCCAVHLHFSVHRCYLHLVLIISWIMVTFRLC